ncbi:MAG: PfkB family carbohydrate kinase [Saccharospirillum sp.]
MSPLEKQILEAIRRNPMATQQQLAEALGMSRESVAAYISRLMKAGEILGKGYLFPQHRHLVVLGGANVDITGRASDGFITGDSNPGVVHQSAGGVGRNIAENLARLGQNVSLITLLGQDARGDWLAQQMQQAGIDTGGVLRDADRTTGTYLALNNDQGELVAAIAAMAIADALTPERLRAVQPMLVAADVLVVEANVPEATLAWLASLPLRGRLYADAVSATKAPRLSPLLPKLTGLKVNLSEARALLGEPQADAEAAARALLERGVDQVLLSLGHQGLAHISADTRVQLPGYPVEIISDTGAGDALLAGVIHAQCQGRTAEQQTAFGLACAAITLGSEQANAPHLTEQQVLEWIAQH